MKEVYRADLGAHVVIGGDERVRAIRHTQEFWRSPAKGLATVQRYLHEVASLYGIPARQLANLGTPVDYLEPREQEPEYRLSDEKRQFDSTAYGFAQTSLNVPVWRAGLKVIVKHDPDRVIASTNTGEDEVRARLPAEPVIERYRRLFLAADAEALQAQGRSQSPGAGTGGPGADFLAHVFRLDGAGRDRVAPRLIRGRFWIYRYDIGARLRRNMQGSEDRSELPFDPPPPADSIGDGADHMVAEISFEVATRQNHRPIWRALVELETGSILYLRPLSANVKGMVFETDPITKTGNTRFDHRSSSRTLLPLQDDVPLQNLAAPVGGIQSLAGRFARVTQVEGPRIETPTQPAGSDFHYWPRTNDFAAVSGYFQVDRVFRLMEELGFDLSVYMRHTQFPIPVDIRCHNEINAHCQGNGRGGIGHVGYGLMDLDNTANPLGRVCDPYSSFHELLGHGILFEHVNDPNFHFAHSAGDGIAGIYFDPASNCKGVDGRPLGKPGDLRFAYSPWVPSIDPPVNRRSDRDVAAGWAWGGSHDDSDRGAEEILSTTHFNIYRSIGGDSADLGRRQFASRMMIYLILRAIGNLTEATNPRYARQFADELMTADTLNSRPGISGGAYHKVIRWAFEKQGEYQSPLLERLDPGFGAVITPGLPPEVDVYIDDGRAGEYPYQPVHWHTIAIWNRRDTDGPTHEEPALIADNNRAYVKIKNRGTRQATGVVVRGYHSKPGAGLSWPGDFDPLGTAQILVGTLDTGEEKTVGPFYWRPHLNAYGHDCLLMVVSADGDAANTDNFTDREPIPEWRLVPNDNNIGQRNVDPVPGAGAGEGLLAGLDGISFWLGNPDPERATMRLEANLPAVLSERGWRIELEGVGDDGFELDPGDKREIVIRLHRGRDFTAEEIARAEDRDIQIVARADDNVIGGMTYRLDPDLKQPFNKRPAGGAGGAKGAAGRWLWWLLLLLLIVLLLLLLG